MDARKNLDKLDDSALRKIAKKISKAVDGNYQTIEMLRRRTDEGYDSVKKLYRLGHKVRWVIGKRRGHDCPALKVKHDTSPYRKRVMTYFQCGVEPYNFQKNSYNFFHRCAECRLSKKQAFNKMVYKDVFAPKSTTDY